MITLSRWDVCCRMRSRSLSLAEAMSASDVDGSTRSCNGRNMIRSRPAARLRSEYSKTSEIRRFPLKGENHEHGEVAVITGASSGIGAGIHLSGCCDITVD